MTVIKKKVILFPAGASGNFLAAFLSPDDRSKAQYRIDLGQSVFGATFLECYDNEEGLTKLIDEIKHGKNLTILSHYSRVSDLRQYSDEAWIRKIFPKNNVFGWIKNVFFKKQHLEMVDWSRANFTRQLDGMLCNINDWYQWLKQDTDTPDDLVIDFDRVTDLDYLVSLHRQFNGFDPLPAKLEFAENYIKQQHRINDTDSKDLQMIIDMINPTDIFDLAIIIFIYEKNHNTVDANRLWSIDHMPTDMSEALDFLKNNEKNYTIFLEK